MNLTPEVKKSLLKGSLHVGAALVMMGSYALMKFRVISKLEFYCAFGAMIVVLLSGQVADWKQHRRAWQAGDRGPVARLSQYSGVLVAPAVGLLVAFLNYALFDQHLISEGWHSTLQVVTRMSFGASLLIVLALMARDLKKEQEVREKGEVKC